MQNEGRDDVELNFMNPINHVRYVSNNTNSAIKGGKCLWVAITSLYLGID